MFWGLALLDENVRSQLLSNHGTPGLSPFLTRKFIEPVAAGHEWLCLWKIAMRYITLSTIRSACKRLFSVRLFIDSDCWTIFKSISM